MWLIHGFDSMFNGQCILFLDVINHTTSSKMKIKDIAYFSSEHPKNCVRNLVTGNGKWTTPVNSKLEVLDAEFCLPSLSSITGVDIGNFWSASVEILVGLSEWPQSRREILLPEQIRSEIVQSNLFFMYFIWKKVFRLDFYLK